MKLRLISIFTIKPNNSCSLDEISHGDSKGKNILFELQKILLKQE